MGQYYDSSMLDHHTGLTSPMESAFYDARRRHESERRTEDAPSIPVHPLGIKPSGNAFTATTNLRAAIGRFESLPDELILSLLETLDQLSLVILGSTCRALYAFCRTEDLWKALFIRSPPLEFSWQGTWRSTLLQLDASHVSPIKCTDLFSDALYRPFQCAHIPLLSFTDHMPVANQMPRLSDLSPQEFYKSWTDKPFILTEPARKWPVYVDWSTDVLLAKYGNIAFRAEAVDWPLKTYVNYMNNNSDESPLYLFDKDFVGKMNLEVGGRYYWPPECFGDDLFALLGDQRPDSRWLIIGPERSGSTFHKDPNATSAWNAVLRGSKYWIMFPTHPGMPPPPGVFVSEDQSEVTSPLSIAEWLLTFHTEARRTRGCMEGICCEGEILHVPSGWWHLVVNLTSAIAITQNFIPRTHLGAALDFLENKPDQITGFKKEVESPHRLFVDKLREHEPALLEEALRERTPAVGDKKRKWDDLVHDDKIESIDAGGFNFGFSSDGENDDLD